MLVRVPVERQRIPAAYGGVHEAHGREIVDGDHWHFVEEDGLGLLHRGATGGGIGGAVGLEEERVVGQAGPAGVVVARTAAEDVEEALRIGEVCSPFTTHDGVVESATFREERG